MLSCNVPTTQDETTASQGRLRHSSDKWDTTIEAGGDNIPPAFSCLWVIPKFIESYGKMYTDASTAGSRFKRLGVKSGTQGQLAAGEAPEVHRIAANGIKNSGQIPFLTVACNFPFKATRNTRGSGFDVTVAWRELLGAELCSKLITQTYREIGGDHAKLH